MFKKRETPFAGCVLLDGPVFSDDRGVFKKIYNEQLFLDAGVNIHIKEQYFSSSYKNVIRGMHFQMPPFEHDKIVSCVKGSALDVVVDLRKKQPTYRKVYSVILNDIDNVSIIVPKGMAHGFMALEDSTILLYRVSTEYEPTSDCGISYNSINFDWGISNAIVSSRDLSFCPLSDFDSPFL